MQYFPGDASFTNEAPFWPSLFVEIGERLSSAIIKSISDIVIAHGFELEQKKPIHHRKEKK